jgi:hypothetical protein
MNRALVVCGRLSGATERIAQLLGRPVSLITGFPFALPSAALVGEPSGSRRVISTGAYDGAYQKYNYSMGSVIALVMGVVELAVIVLLLFMGARLYRGPSAGGKD